MNLSTFLAEHVKAQFFNGGRFLEGETFDAALERVLHNGIFLYRKRILDGKDLTGDCPENLISAALMAAEPNNPYNAKSAKSSGLPQK